MSSLLRPSSAARRVACPGSHKLELLYPQEQSEAAIEGTQAHAVAEALYKNQPLPQYASDEMIEGAHLYVNHLRSIAGNAAVLEQRIHIQSIHPNCFGTPDAYYFHDNVLHIWDYKFGFGQVEVFANYQLIEYASGIIHDVLKLRDDSIEVNFYIVQPRGFHKDGRIRTWPFSVSGLIPFFNILKHTEREALSDNAFCNPSPECKYCKARHSCVALQESALSAVELSREAMPFDLNATQLGNELRILHQAAKLLDARITGLTEQAISFIKKGNNIPHYQLKPMSGRKVWTIPIDEVIAMGELLGEKLEKPRDVITPTQALDAGVLPELIAAFSDIKRGEVKLVPAECKI